MRAVSLLGPLLVSCAEEVGTYGVGVAGGFESADAQTFMISFDVFGIPNMCSAALIGRRTLVTAAHCLDGSLYPGDPTLRFSATNAVDAKGASRSAFIDVTDIRIHPGWGLRGLENDIGLALLSRDPGVPPKPWNSEDVALMEGQPARILGYGYTIPDDYTSWGVLHETPTRLESVEPAFLNLRDGQERGACNGDSGGPTYMSFPDGTERVVGVHSTGATCFESRDVRLDFHRTFIDTWLAEHEGAPTSDAGSLADSSVADAGSADAAASFDAGAQFDDATLDGGPREVEAGRCRGCRDHADCTSDEVCVISGPSTCCVPGSRTQDPPPAESQPDDRLKTLRDVDSCSTYPGSSLVTILALGWAMMLHIGRRPKER